MADVVWRGSEAELMRRLALLPAVLAGEGNAQDARRLTRALGVEMLSILKDAFVTKARGGTDEAGIKWAPLKPATIAYGRRHKGLNSKRKAAAKKGRAGRPLLTDRQDTLWRGVYAGALRSGKDSAAAAAIAWSVVKKAGGKTIKGTHGGAQVEILRDTGRLLNSLSPGHAGNILEPRAGSVSVGTNVEYAPYHHYGTSRLPARPLWPEDQSRFPQVWMDRLSAVLGQAVAQMLQRRLGA